MLKTFTFNWKQSVQVSGLVSKQDNQQNQGACLCWCCFVTIAIKWVMVENWCFEPEITSYKYTDKLEHLQQVIYSTSSRLRRLKNIFLLPPKLFKKLWKFVQKSLIKANICNFQWQLNSLLARPGNRCLARSGKFLSTFLNCFRILWLLDVLRFPKHSKTR